MSIGYSKENPVRCLVLGGTGALGQTVCRMLAQNGARIAYTWHESEEVGKKLTKELPNCSAFSLDASKITDIEHVVDGVAQAIGGIDALIHCIAVGMTQGNGEMSSFPGIEETEEEDWDHMMAVNVKSIFFACRSALRHMRKGSGGNIIITGSIDGVKQLPALIHYATSKAALSGMTQSMAKEFGKFGIRVNTVAPGLMEDGLSKNIPNTIFDEYKKYCGLQRLGRLSEVAGLVTWLAMENTYISGQTILVDGGL